MAKTGRSEEWQKGTPRESGSGSYYGKILKPWTTSEKKRQNEN